MKLHEKIKVIRIKLLKMNQSKFACAAAAKQKDISLLENGKKEFIPNRYLEYLAKEGVDLNSLFHPEKEVCFLSSGKESGSSQKTLACDKLPPQKAMEALYEMRDLLNKALKIRELFLKE